MRLVGIALILLGAFSGAAADQALRLRQQYNQVAAGIDSLVQRYGAESLGRVAREKAPKGGIPKGMSLVLIFWADDEAEVFLNGFPVGHTRLTPVRIEIPEHFLRPNNRLEAHCWDTERVESGFMAGLYLEDFDKQLRPIVLTQPEGWRSGDGPANAIYYSHALPEIPGAQVIWGQRLLGEVWLESQFPLSAIQRAAYRSGRPLAAASDEVMEAQEVVGRLAKLQKRLEGLDLQLGKYQNPVLGPTYQKGRSGGLSFTLGKAPGPTVAADFKVASTLLQWAERLPAQEQRLVFRDPRPLKGTGSATASGPRSGQGKNAREDRRYDYRPPEERGAGASGAVTIRAGSDIVERMRAQWFLGIPPKFWLGIVGLAVYMGFSGRYWWLLYSEKVWKK